MPSTIHYFPNALSSTYYQANIFSSFSSELQEDISQNKVEPKDRKLEDL